MTNDLATRTRRLVAQASGAVAPEELRPDTPLLHGGLHLDSIATLELLLALEKEFSIELDAVQMRDAHALKTFGSLCAFLEQRCAEGPSA